MFGMKRQLEILLKFVFPLIITRETYSEEKYQKSQIILEFLLIYQRLQSYSNKTIFL